MIKWLIIVGILLVSVCASAQDYKSDAKIFLQNNLAKAKLRSVEEVLITDAYPNASSGTFVVYIQQLYQGIRVSNAVRTLIFKNGELVVQRGDFLTTPKNVTKSKRQSVTAPQAASNAMAHLKIKKPANFGESPVKSSPGGQEFTFNGSGVSQNNIPATLMWLPSPDGTFTLCWEIGIHPEKSTDSWLIRVGAESGEIINKVNLTVYCEFVHPGEVSSSGHNHVFHTGPKTKELSQIFAVDSAAYRVIAFPSESPSHSGGTFTIVKNPWEAAGASNPAVSLKWHNDGTNEYNYTRGNNVYAQEDTNKDNIFGTPATSSTALPKLTFTSVFDPDTLPTTAINQAAAITNLFYWNNITHDILYQYGFDEVSGNFQMSNQGRGGLGNDYVIADAQDGGGLDNANFSTPPDGARPRMQMYLWNTRNGTTVQRDGDFDNGIIVHEYGHGVSNRLTGGPSQVACLQNAEQMGEGWSDYYALMLTTNWAGLNLTDGTAARPIGTYALAQFTTGSGIRRYPYTTNMSVNPFTYANVASANNGSVHYIGSIWCTMIWDMTWELIQETGSISNDLYNQSGEGGNVIAMRLVTEALKIQPCSPGFVDGRNAILTADTLLYGGQYSCAIWRAFARRGLGVSASQGSSFSYTDQSPAFDIPSGTIHLTSPMSRIAQGEEIEYSINVDCRCADFLNYTVVDSLPANTTYVSGGTFNATTEAVSFGSLSLNVGQSTSFKMRIVNNNVFDTTTYFTSDGTTLSPWVSSSLLGSRAWQVYNDAPSSSIIAWHMATNGSNATTALTSPPYILTSRTTTLTFSHFIDLEDGYDGGVVEVSTDNGLNWIDLGNKISKNGYNFTIDDCCGTYLSGKPAFSGYSGSFIETIIDLSSFVNDTILIRFLVAEDYSVSSNGWFIDDIQLRSENELSNTAYLLNGETVVSKSTLVTPLIQPRDIQSVVSGLWNSPGTWSCTCVPLDTDIVTINSNHTVTIDGFTARLRRFLTNKGRLNFVNNGALQFSD